MDLLLIEFFGDNAGEFCDLFLEDIVDFDLGFSYGYAGGFKVNFPNINSFTLSNFSIKFVRVLDLEERS